MTSTIGLTYTPDVQRYIVQSSDVLSEHRLTVSPLADPSSVIWYTERYISHPASGPPEIVENIVHQPTNTICWSVHRPTNIRRQGWYVRLRSPMFPPGVSIPMQPVSTTSPYYVDGALSFKCRTTAVAAQSNGDGARHNGRPAPMLRTSTSSVSSVAGSSSTVQHSYPPTPAASSPPQPLLPLGGRPELPPLQTSSRTGKGRSLTGEGDGVHVIGLDETTGEEHTDNAKTPTSAATITQAHPKSPPLAEFDIGLLEEEPLSAKGRDADPLVPLQATPKPNGLPRRVPPPQRLPAPVSITEFILVPLSETASASCGPYANLSPSVASDASSPVSPLYPHSHHRTYSSSFSRGGAAAAPNFASRPQRNSTGVFGKALSLLKSTLPTAVTSSVAATWQGNSFTIVRIPEATAAPPTLNSSAASSPPAYTSTTNLLGTPGPSSSTSTLVNGAASSYPFHTTQSSISSVLQGANAISSASFVQPLPPPLLSFTDETSLFGPLPGFGIGKLLGYPSSGSYTPTPRINPRPVSLPVTSPTSSSSTSTLAPTPSSSSSTLAPPFPLHPNPTQQPQQPPRGTPTPNYTTLGTLTVSTSQLASLGVDTAFWVSCALVFWGYLEEREGYLSAVDD
ncbi:hypothetical protein BKA70DRAFT_1193072 [Coprinopsis sp. MPI-PUGE-AT-0042]|nr:hypothetical protein BKA70DRAFT_1193072 [Coprinopsis sp. MPI-PUGE-AT-0042]